MRYVKRYDRFYKVDDNGVKTPITMEEWLGGQNKAMDPLETLRSYTTMKEAIAGEETDDDSSDHESEWED